MNDDQVEVICAGLVMCFVVAAASLMIGVVLWYKISTLEVPLIAVPGCNLPCKCVSYYNLGTDEWIDCMQVGYK